MTVPGPSPGETSGIRGEPVPILVYHSVSWNPPPWIAKFAVTPAVFAAHLDAVLASGRQPLTVSRFVDGLRGTARLPQRPVLITIDDGLADVAEHAAPALAARGLTATLYVITGALAGRPWDCVLPPSAMVSAAAVRELEAAGVEIGAHSHTHRQLDLLPRRVVADELTRSWDLLAEALGHPVRSFAYPHGYWRPAVRRLVAAAGFDSACAVGNALCSARDHPLALSRIMVRAGDDASTVAAWLRGQRVGVFPRGGRLLAFGWRQVRRARRRMPPWSVTR